MFIKYDIVFFMLYFFDKVTKMYKGIWRKNINELFKLERVLFLGIDFRARQKPVYLNF